MKQILICRRAHNLYRVHISAKRGGVIQTLTRPNLGLLVSKERKLTKRGKLNAKITYL